ncbi:MAG: 2Fe-2S iron-sulfur cluster-binding protein [Elainellaceae cyanobacterium]
MFNGIGEIKNPLARAALSAGISFTAATMLGGAFIGFEQKEDDAYRQVGYGAIAIAVVGGLAGLLAGSSGSAKPSSSITEDRWTDWRDFVVTRKVPESVEITSFYLKPKDGGTLPNFKPGQFLTIRLDIPDQPRPVIRTYSLSDFGQSPDHYRLSIKRERSPSDLDVPPGVASNFMHDQVEEGTVIPAKPPSGKFVVDPSASRPAVLISNGVGITPMIAMAKAIGRLNPQRHVWFLHGARHGEFHAFDQEVGGIEHPNLHTYYRYSRPRPEDEGKYHSQGYVDTEMLTNIVIPKIKEHHAPEKAIEDAPKEAEYYLCGSPSFMDDLRSGLDDIGVPKTQVFFESFSKPSKAAATTERKGDSSAASSAADSAEVTFARSGKTATWTPEAGTLLEFAEAQGINPDYSCRQGVCLTCMCGLETGEVAYDEEPTGTPDDGAVLICVSKPKTAQVTLDL